MKKKKSPKKLQKHERLRFREGGGNIAQNSGGGGYPYLGGSTNNKKLIFLCVFLCENRLHGRYMIFITSEDQDLFCVQV